MTTKAPDLREAIEALGALPNGYCFCSSNRTGDDSKAHEPECRNIRAALAHVNEPPKPEQAAVGVSKDREDMVYFIECTLQEHPAQHESAWHRAHYVADALISAGWRRIEQGEKP